MLCLLILVGCDSGTKAPGPVSMSESELERWEIALVEMRIEKNETLADSTKTCLPLEKLTEFEGLNYYYPKPSLRFRVPLQPVAGVDTVVLTKRRGEQIPYLRRGTVSFRIEGKTHDLDVFGPVDTTEHGDFLWLPFYDTTNSTETYAGGRYLDLELTAGDSLEVDFNYAYNPLCDYNPKRYNCTLPPAENTLSIPIQAGEKRFGLSE
jgi:uncharacterized protein (DUF1684 family)